MLRVLLNDRNSVCTAAFNLKRLLVSCPTTLKEEPPEVFSKSQHGSFFQDMPVISNPFSSDYFLQRSLSRYLPKDVSCYISTCITSSMKMCIGHFY